VELVVFEKLVESLQWESGFVYGEVLVVDHIVNITPECIEWNAILGVVSDDLFIFNKALISPSALVESKRPEWWNHKSSHIVMVHLDCVFRTLISKEIPKVNDASSDLVGKITAPTEEQWSINLEVKTIGVPQEHNVVVS